MSSGVSRRTVLKVSGVAAGAIGLVGTGVVGVRAGFNGAFDAGQGDPYEAWKGWEGIEGNAGLIAAGTLAANPHNIQPWIFTSHEASITVSSDDSRAMPINDPDGRERAAGFGCAIENIIVAARARGLNPTLDLHSDGTTGQPVGTITLAAGSAPTATESLLAKQIVVRHSNRGPYSATPITESTLSDLATCVYPGLSVKWIADQGGRAALGSVLVDATEAIVQDEEMSVEGFSWFRNERADIDRYRDGLTLDCQGLDPVTLFFAKVLPAQSRSDGDAFWVKTTREVNTATAAAYGVIVADAPSDAATRIAVGRTLQRIHLAATAAGVAFQHMNQITEWMQRAASTAVTDTLGPRLASVVGVPQDTIMLLFRVGYPTRDAKPSPRRSLASVTVA